MQYWYFIFLVSLVTSVFGQGEANNWYFGQNAGLNFSTTPPTVLTNGNLDTLEGCATISDATGNLLFYTDGTTIYNRNHAIMPNGTDLHGDNSSTSSALVVPQPRSSNRYIVFTVDEPHQDNADTDPTTIDGDGVNNGFAYSVVDMTLNGGNGAVVTGQKNRPLITYDTSDSQESLYKCSEKITAVKSDDCDSFWVITHFVDSYYAFKVDQTGVDPTPVVSRVGITVPVSGYRRNALGYLKAAPDGSKIAVAHLGIATVTGEDAPGRVMLYDFDASTGLVSNETVLYTGDAPYGIEFAQSGNRLYTTIGIGDGGAGGSFLMQFDLTVPTNQIAATATRIPNQNGQETAQVSAGALQLATDGKIYRALIDFDTLNGNFLGVIENPEAIASAVQYSDRGININPDGNRASRIGLPPFIQSIFEQKINITGNTDPNNTNVERCEGETFRLSHDDIPTATYSWFLDDMPLTNTSFFLDITTAGNYRLEVDLNDGSCPLIGVATVVFNPLPNANASTLGQCDQLVNTSDGITVFNLEQAIPSLTNTANTTVTFFENRPNALAGSPFITNPTSYQNTIPNQLLFVRVTNTDTGCFSTTTLDLFTTSTTANNTSLEACDDTGIADFDLTQATPSILAGVAGSNLSVTYYSTSSDALSEVNPIGTSYTNTVSGTQGEEIIYARVEDDLNQCFGINEVALFVYSFPEIETEGTAFLCESDPAITIDSGLLSGRISDNTYLWSTGETTESIQIDTTGTYTVAVSSRLGNCTSTRTVAVSSSDVATLLPPTIIDATTNNRVTINYTGIGDYEFAIGLNDSNIRTYQDSPLFTDVPAGNHVIYARDKNGCGEVQAAITVVGFPKYFTPNGDAFHPTWNVEGTSDNLPANTRIDIFDRHGKLLKQILAGGQGWDGTLNGAIMPSSEYWFRTQLIDGRIVRGSFSLIR